MAARIEQARGFHTGLVLAPQVVQGMGDENEAARITGSVETVICHRVNTPEEIVQLAGTRQRMEYSTHYAREGSTGEGSARVQHQYKVDPNKVRGLEPGAAYIISRGRAMRAQVLQAPNLRGELPEACAPRAGERGGPASTRSASQGEPPLPAEGPNPFRPDTAGSETFRPAGVPFGGGSSEKEVGTLPF